MLQWLGNKHSEGEGKRRRVQQEGGLPAEKEKTEEEEKRKGKAVPGMRGKSYTKSWPNLMLSGNIDAFRGGTGLQVK